VKLGRFVEPTFQTIKKILPNSGQNDGFEGKCQFSEFTRRLRLQLTPKMLIFSPAEGGG
jgi:hypothetical protein